MTLNLSTIEADSDFLTGVILFTIYENVSNFLDGRKSLENLQFIQNIERESFFNLKVIILKT